MSHHHVVPCCACSDSTLLNKDVYSFKGTYVLRLVLERFISTRHFDFCDEELGLNKQEWSLISTLRDSLIHAPPKVLSSILLHSIEDVDRFCQIALESIVSEGQSVDPSLYLKQLTDYERYHNILVRVFQFAVPFTQKCMNELSDPPQVLFDRVVQQILQYLKDTNVFSWMQHIMSVTGHPFPCCACSEGTLLRHVQHVHAWKMDVIVRNLLELSLHQIIPFQDQGYSLSDREARLLETLSRYLETPYDVSMAEINAPEDIGPQLKGNLVKILNRTLDGVAYETLLVECLRYTGNLATRCMEQFNQLPEKFNAYRNFRSMVKEMFDMLEKKNVLSWLRHVSVDPDVDERLSLFQNSEAPRVYVKSPLTLFYAMAQCCTN